VIVFRAWQDPAFITALKTEMLHALIQNAGKDIRIDPGVPLDEFLQQGTRTLRGSLFFILDQFEDYFLYQPPTQTEAGFEAEFARAVNRRDIDAHFLVALREDSLSKLDRFKGRIPNLLSNTLRLEHLDRAAAMDAIRKPLEEYNRHLTAGQPPVTIEDALVEAVIHQVQAGQVTLGRGGRGQAEFQAEGSGERVQGSDIRIETPYLQLVMTHLWSEERKAHSNILRLASLERLGGAERIVRTHLDATMSGLSNAERLVAARAFRYLVTPSGTKIAYSPSDLANYAGVSPLQLSPVLLKLSGPQTRVLRGIAPPAGTVQEPRYEIFHDVLGPAVLDWRERYLQQVRTGRLRLAGAALGAVIVLVIAVLMANLLITRAQLAQTAQQAKGASDAVLTLVPEAPAAGGPTVQPSVAALRKTAVVVATDVAPQVQQQPIPEHTNTTTPAPPQVGNPYADRVVSFTPGSQAPARFSNTKAVLGKPDFDESTLSGFLTLGIGGSITIEFVDNIAVDGPGPDIEIFGDPSSDEQWIIEASADCVNFKSFGKVRERVKLDLAAVGLTSARCVRLTDGGDPTGGLSPGAELDAVAALNSAPPTTGGQPLTPTSAP
jgi:hypothetical protein